MALINGASLWLDESLPTNTNRLTYLIISFFRVWINWPNTIWNERWFCLLSDFAFLDTEDSNLAHSDRFFGYLKQFVFPSSSKETMKSGVFQILIGISFDSMPVIPWNGLNDLGMKVLGFDKVNTHFFPEAEWCQGNMIRIHPTFTLIKSKLFC